MANRKVFQPTIGTLLGSICEMAIETISFPSSLLQWCFGGNQPDNATNPIRTEGGDNKNRVSCRQFQAIYNALAEGIVVIDSQGSITDCNSAAVEIFGIPQDQVCGRNPRDPRWRAIREDGGDLPGDEMPAVMTLKSGRAVSQFVHGIIRPDGQFDRIVAIITDITEKVEVKQKLKTAESRLELALKVSNTGMWEWNIQTGQTYYSNTWFTMLGYVPKELPMNFAT